MQTEQIEIDTAFWGIKLQGTNKILIAQPWDFDRTHQVVCGIVKLAGVEIAESFLGMVVPAFLREREHAEQVVKAPAELGPELRMNLSAGRWADIRVALEGRMPNIREALSRMVAALADPVMLRTVLGELTVSQGRAADGTLAMPLPVLQPAAAPGGVSKLSSAVFARPQDVYAALLAVAMENLFPLDGGGRAIRSTSAKSGASLPPVRHWLAYSKQ